VRQHHQQRHNLRTQRIFAIIGPAASAMLVISYVVSLASSPTAMSHLLMGVWLCLGAMFIDGLIALRKS